MSFLIDVVVVILAALAFAKAIDAWRNRKKRD